MDLCDTCRPKPPIKLFSTGVGLKERQPDPHWQLVAISDDSKFRPRQALVTAASDYLWLPNSAGRSQWISLVDDASSVPDAVTYTFRTTFDLTGMAPMTVRLSGLFLVDDRLSAMRLNGVCMPFPNHDNDRAYNTFQRFTIDRGFVEGVNVLEFDMRNGTIPGRSSQMGLRVDLEGSALLK